MSELLNYIKERSSMSGCNTNKWKCNTFDYCDLCLESQIKEHDKRIREQTIEKVEELIRIRLVDSLCLTDATKYGNRNAVQQANSYATVMKYEIESCVDDLLDDLEELKGGAENE